MFFKENKILRSHFGVLKRSGSFSRRRKKKLRLFFGNFMMYDVHIRLSEILSFS
jgi:hypothetical protein